MKRLLNNCKNLDFFLKGSQNKKGRAPDLESDDPGLNSGFGGKVLCYTAQLSQDESSSICLLGVMPRIAWSESNSGNRN